MAAPQHADTRSAADDRRNGHRTPQPEVVALGELLVDFIQIGFEHLPTEDEAARSEGGQVRAKDKGSQVGNKGLQGEFERARMEGEGDPAPAEPSPQPRALFARAAGGAPANVAAACSALGVPSAFVGKVGDDPNGRFLIEAVARTGVDTRGIVADPAYATTLAFASDNQQGGGLAYSFARKPGADLMLDADEVDKEVIGAAKVLHVGTFSLAGEPSRHATLSAMRTAREAELLVSLDVNLRPHAWPSQSDMHGQARRAIAHADLVKASVEEMEALTGERSVAAGIEKLLDQGPHLVAITFGADGAVLATRNVQARCPGYAAERVVDTAGAGDTFWGATLAWLLHAGNVRRVGDISSMTASELTACVRFACAAASLSVERRGALGSAPTATQVARRLEG